MAAATAHEEDIGDRTRTEALPLWRASCSPRELAAVAVSAPEETEANAMFDATGARRFAPRSVPNACGGPSTCWWLQRAVNAQHRGVARCRLGCTVRPLVPGDAAPAIAQRVHLRCEHLVIHQETVREHDDIVPVIGTVAAGVFEVQALSVHVRVRHAPTLSVA